MKDKPKSEMTMREVIAMHAMQGLASNKYITEMAMAPGSKLTIASLAVDMSDALIKALNK